MEVRMKTKRILFCMGLALFLLLAGCSNLPAGTPDIAATIAMDVSIAQTSAAIQTSMAGTEMGVNPALPTETPTLNPQSQTTPTSQFTTTPDFASLTLTRDTYCRKGTSSSSPAVSLLTAGQSAEIIALNPTRDSYYVVDPLHSNSQCWVWGQYATVIGDMQILPVFTSMPTATATFTPTPASGFSVSYVNTENCGADYAFRYLIKNTGKVTWQSLQIVMTDTLGGAPTTHTSNSFNSYAGCALSGAQEDLTPGEEALLLAINPGQVGYNPAGRPFTATVMICQNNDLGGCISKSLSFTP
jgi:hypothetical protein